MKVIFPCSINPYFDSSAIGNRYEGLIDGLLNKDVKITLIIIGGYSSFSEFKKKGRKFNNPNLEVRYTIFTFQSSLWLRRINKYILSGLFQRINEIKLKKYYKSSYDYLWLTGNYVVRKSFLNNLNLVKGKVFIELSEYQELYKTNGYAGNSLQLKREIEYTEITMEALNHVDCFAVMTNTLIKYYKGLTKNQEAKFLHLPMTVNLKRFQNVKQTITYKQPYIAFTGTYTNLKDGVDVLIKAFGKIVSQYPDFHLYLAGFYHGDILLQKRIISELGLNDKITYLGVLDKNKIPEFICNADLLVLPRPDSYQAQGGFPTKLGEYLATSKPVCVTKIGEIPNYLEDNISAFLSEPGSVDSFADAMLKALLDKNKAMEVGKQGRSVAEKYFNIDIQSKLLYSFLKENI